jgi:hypothetical protein
MISLFIAAPSSAFPHRPSSARRNRAHLNNPVIVRRRFPDHLAKAVLQRVADPDKLVQLCLSKAPQEHSRLKAIPLPEVFPGDLGRDGKSRTSGLFLSLTGRQSFSFLSLCGCCYQRFNPFGRIAALLL